MMTGAQQIIPYVGVGHSHIVALAQGAYALQRAGAPYDGRFHYLYDPQFDPPFPDPERPGALNAALVQAIEAHNPRFLVASMGGNEHNVISIVQHHGKYDFVLGENPDLFLDESAQILPEAAIRETLRDWMADKTAVLQALRALTDIPIVHVAPPPPAPRAQVLTYPKEFFKTGVSLSKLSSDLLRYKVWRVQTGLARAISRALGLLHIDVAADALDADGMLAQSLCGTDATHANEAYGAATMRRVLAAPELAHLTQNGAESRAS